MSFRGYLNEAGVLTSSGRLAVTCPLDPIWWRVIEAGGRFGCSEEIVDIAATLSVQQSIFHSPRPHQQAARFVRTCFTSIVSDHLAYLSAFNAFRSAQSLADKEGLDLDEWCHEHFLNRRAMEDALNIRESVRQFLRQTSVPPKTCSAGDNEMVRKALAVGFFSHAAIHQGGDLYKTVHGNVTALLSPDSGLIDKGHEWIVFNEVRQTAKPYLVVATAVKPEWIQVRYTY